MHRSPAKSPASTPHRPTRRLLSAMMMGVCCAGPASAQVFIWNGDQPGFWDDNDGFDWVDAQTQSTTFEPFGGDGAFAFIDNGGSVEIRQDILDIQTIHVGDFSSGTSTLFHSAGSTQVPGGTAGKMVVGQNGSIGTYIMEGSALQAKSIMEIGVADNNDLPGGQGILSMKGSSAFIVDQFGAGLRGNVQNRSFADIAMSENASFMINDLMILANGAMGLTDGVNGSVGSGLWVGNNDAGVAVLSMNSFSAVDVAGNIRIGRNGGNGTVNLSGAAQLNKVGGNDNYISVGFQDNSRGTLNISQKARLVSTTNMILAENGARSGVVNQIGGYVELQDNTGQAPFADSLVVDASREGLGQYNLSGGTLKAQTIDALTGAFNFSGGRLLLSSRYKGDLLQTGGIFAPGSSPGEVTIEGDYNLNADEIDGVLEIELGGTVPGADFDKVNVIGDVNIVSGILRVLLYEGFLPAVGDSFDFMDWTGTLSGEYDALQLPNMGGGMMWDTDDLYAKGALRVMLAGDTDGDGDVDDSDLGTSFANYTGPVGEAGGQTMHTGDTDGDGDVDDSDLGTSFANYTGPLTPATVPEPGSIALFVTGLVCVLTRRRK